MDLTYPERLLLYRRRHKWTQDQLALRWGTTWRKIRDAERGRCVLKPVSLTTEPTSNERCLILRRRHSLRQEDVARKLGLSRITINHMEKGTRDCTRLLTHLLSL